MGVFHEEPEVTEARIDSGAFDVSVRGLDGGKHRAAHGCRINQSAGVIDQV